MNSRPEIVVFVQPNNIDFCRDELKFCDSGLLYSLMIVTFLMRNSSSAIVIFAQPNDIDFPYEKFQSCDIDLCTLQPNAIDFPHEKLRSRNGLCTA